jgi:hypothetical protein
MLDELARPLLVFGREIEVLLAWHGEQRTTDRSQRSLGVTVESRRRADVRGVPGTEQCDQIVGVAISKEPLPEAESEVLVRGVSHLPPFLGPVERLREAPPSVDPRERLQPFDRRAVRRVVTVVENGIGHQRGPERFQEDFVVRRRDTGPAERCSSLDHLGMADRPLVGLSGTHRPPGHQCDLGDAEVLGEQFVLCGNLIQDADMRESGPVVGHRRVRRRRGDTIAQHVRNDDEPIGNLTSRW